jgi:uncharacterized membrane protein YiaA
VMKWRNASGGPRAVAALAVSGIAVNAIVFGVAVAVVGPYRSCVGLTGTGVDSFWLFTAIVVALVVVITFARRIGASAGEIAVLALMQVSLSAGLALLAFVLPLQAGSGCWSF